MRFRDIIQNTLDSLEIEFFDDDPEDDPDRAGYGYYFRYPGETGWSGAWQSRRECKEVAAEELIERYDWLESKLHDYERLPENRDRRFVVKGYVQRAPLDEATNFFVWLDGEKNSRRRRWIKVYALIDAPDLELARARFKRTIHAKRVMGVTEVRGVLSEVCRDLGLPPQCLLVPQN